MTNSFKTDLLMGRGTGDWMVIVALQPVSGHSLEIDSLRAKSAHSE